ncbi:hypothetical protein AB1399_13765, partial [Hydrogenibacillus schlegelii]
DWERRSDPTAMKWRIFRRLTPGAIVLLHDSGETFGADPTAPDGCSRCWRTFLKPFARSGLRFGFAPPGRGAAGAAGRGGRDGEGRDDAETPYEVPLLIQTEGLDYAILSHFHLAAPPADLAEWDRLFDRLIRTETAVEIDIVGKYVGLIDA